MRFEALQRRATVLSGQCGPGGPPKHGCEDYRRVVEAIRVLMPSLREDPWSAGSFIDPWVVVDRGGFQIVVCGTCDGSECEPDERIARCEECQPKAAPDAVLVPLRSEPDAVALYVAERVCGLVMARDFGWQAVRADEIIVASELLVPRRFAATLPAELLIAAQPRVPAEYVRMCCRIARGLGHTPSRCVEDAPESEFKLRKR